jgi:threonine dehydrogenase-like Zn-dependent dehydrogenase
MKAVCWHGARDVRTETVPEPAILNRHDAIVKINLTAICGSDLHLYGGYLPGMRKGDILGHEFMGEVVEVGREVRKLKAGDRVVVPFTICCGQCFFCRSGQWSLCDNSNPNPAQCERAFGASTAGVFGYTHLLGGFAGGQAQYARVPFADVGPLPVPEGLRDDQVLFLSDIFPTGFQAAENCGIQGGDVIAVWGCGPVGQFAIRSAYLLGAERVLAIDRIPQRLEMARKGGAEILDAREWDVLERLKDLTGGRGPDACIDAVGMEAHGASIDAFYDRAMQAVGLESDRVTVLRQAIHACRKGGTISIAGVYGGMADRFPIGAAFAKGLTFKMGQTHAIRYMKPLLNRIQRGEIDPSFVITHRYPLERAAEAYQVFATRKEDCLKAVMLPNGA